MQMLIGQCIGLVIGLGVYIYTVVDITRERRIALLGILSLAINHLFKRPESEGNHESIPGQEHVIAAHLRLITEFEI
jgi:hypothetical protein